MPLRHKINFIIMEYYRTSGTQRSSENRNDSSSFGADSSNSISRSDDRSFGSSLSESERYALRLSSMDNQKPANNPYVGTPYEGQYNNIINHYEYLIAQAEANRAWYEEIGLSRYTEKLVAQYRSDMFAELRILESTYQSYLLELPENIVKLQNRAGLNSDLIGLQYGGSSGASGSVSGSPARSTSLPSSDPAYEALSMGLSMIGSITSFATVNLPALISSIGNIRGISLDNDLKRQELKLGKFNQYAVENEYLREFALNNFGNYGLSDDDEFNRVQTNKLMEFINMPMSEKRSFSDLPEFLDDERANSYLAQYILSENFKLDQQALRNGNLKLSKENAFLSETYGSDFSSMSEFYRELGPLVRDLEKVTARYNLGQSVYDFNTVSDNVSAEVGLDGSVSFVEQVSDSLDPESATRAVNAGNERSYYQNQFESDVKEVMQKHTSEWSRKANSGEWWSWIYDLLIMALPQFIQGLSSGSISLFRGGTTVNNNSNTNSVTNDYGTKDIISNRYYDGVRESD